MSIPLKEGIIGASLGNSVCMAVSMKLIGRGIKLLSRGDSLNLGDSALPLSGWSFDISD